MVKVLTLVETLAEELKSAKRAQSLAIAKLNALPKATTVEVGKHYACFDKWGEVIFGECVEARHFHPHLGRVTCTLLVEHLIAGAVHEVRTIVDPSVLIDVV
jgi:hypothetical protein